MMFVNDRHSDIKRSMPRISTIAPTGTVGTTERLAASVIKPAPVTPVEPFEVSIVTSNNVISCAKLKCVLVACARNSTASVI